jgi:uncharacterized cupredoxin-like copper-binding protein
MIKETEVLRNLSRAGALALLDVVLCTAAPGAEPQTKTFNVIMVDYSFKPDHLTFEHGVHYKLHLENHGKQTHEFTAAMFFAASKLDNPEILNKERTEIVMQPGDAKDLFLTAPAPGTYDLRCSDHDWDGMVGGITVN